MVDVQERAESSWFSWVWLGYLGIGLFIILMLAISPFSTAYVAFFLSRFWWVPFVIFGLAWGVHALTGVSIMPLGHADDDTYPLQRILGYNGALMVSIIIGFALAIFFGSLVASTQQLFYPVNPVFVTTAQQQVVGDWTYSFFSGATALSQGVASALPASILEDTVAVFLSMLIWLFARYVVGKSIGMSDMTANILGMVAFIIAYPIIFGLSMHVFAYQAVEVAFWRAFSFAFICAIPVALTGFILPIAMAHFANNYVASTMNLIGYGVVIPPA